VTVYALFVSPCLCSLHELCLGEFASSILPFANRFINLDRKGEREREREKERERGGLLFEREEERKAFLGNKKECGVPFIAKNS